jgi:Heterokaryon incompatibility protein (HET)
MAELQRGIEISSLPHVFQDSVQVAQNLDISYLWIDALCIQQDEDHSDWKRESQNMNKVYSHAFLNISATLSSDGQGSESLFGERGKVLSEPTNIKLNIDGTQQNYIILDSNTWVDEIDNAPLNNRGWVFQERFSARKVLHFGRKQLGWECRETEALEGFPKGLPQALTTSAISKSRTFKTLMDLFRSSDRDLDISLASEWRVIVQNYSKCGLTKPDDKLVAFEGVAKGFMANRGGRCVMGIWEHNLIYDLM